MSSPPEEEEECSICCRALSDPEEREGCCVTQFECSHCFHSTCIIRWLRERSSRGRCPVCRGGGNDSDDDDMPDEPPSDDDPLETVANMVRESVPDLARAALARARARDAPRRLKVCSRRLREAKLKLTTNRKELADLRRDGFGSFCNLKARERVLRKAQERAKRQIDHWEVQLSLAAIAAE